MCGGNEKGCEFCTAGKFIVTACPLTLITSDVWQALDACDDAEKGILPEPGGSSSQTVAFMQAWRFVRSEIATHEAEIRKRMAHG